MRGDLPANSVPVVMERGCKKHKVRNDKIH